MTTIIAQGTAAIDAINLLSSLLLKPPASLEILPGDLASWISTDSAVTSDTLPSEERPPSQDFPYLLIDGNLGIPQKVLFRLYISAVSLYGQAKLSNDISLLISTSCVILLANPAHQTAMNTRKHLIQLGKLSLQKELAYVEALVGASKECAKQSLLWDHRRWLLTRLYNADVGVFAQDGDVDHWPTWARFQPSPTIPLPILRMELGIARRACGFYPRNYHAWLHWRYVMHAICYQNFAPIVQSASEANAAILEEMSEMRSWVEAHISDHSAIHQIISFSLFLRGLDIELDRRPGFGNPEDYSQHAMTLLEAYPTQEALWLYLRAASNLLSHDQRTAVVERVKESSFASQHALMEAYLRWLELELET